MITKDVRTLMTKWLHILFVCGVLLLLGGCIMEEGSTPADTGSAQVSFVLSLTDAGASTRATWGDDYTKEVGNNYENRIDPDDVQVMLFDADGYVASVEILSYYPLNDDSDDYRFIGSVTAEEGTLSSGQSYKMMVFANCGKIADNSNLGNLSFAYEADKVKAESQLIPMWGVITEELTLEKGKQQDLGSIDLLRAMAKIEINLADAISVTHTITEATLSKYNSQGYCLPKDYAAVENTKELEQETGNSKDTFNPCINAQVASDLAFSYSDDKQTAWLYIPEYDNSTDAATISITLNDGTTGTLQFKDYTNGTATGDAHDIVRNHIYRYTVNVETGDLTVQYRALPWNLVETSIGWKPQPASTTENPFKDKDSYTSFVNGNNYILLPRYSYSSSRNTTQLLFNYLYPKPKTGDDEAVRGFVCRPGYNTDNTEHTELKVGSGGARFFFMLTGPEGATWEAHLTDTVNFTFSTSEVDDFKNSEYESQDGKSVHMATHGIAREKPYILQIIARNDYTEGTSFEDLTDWGSKKWNGQQVVDTEFYITVKLTDGTEYELTINPSYKNCQINGLKEDKNFYFKERRRYAGTDTRIWIRQLRAQEGWDYDTLVKNVSATTAIGTGTNNFAWWRVNPYWY